MTTREENIVKFNNIAEQLGLPVIPDGAQIGAKDVERMLLGVMAVSDGLESDTLSYGDRKTDKQRAIASNARRYRRGVNLVAKTFHEPAQRDVGIAVLAKIFRKKPDRITSDLQEAAGAPA